MIFIPLSPWKLFKISSDYCNINKQINDIEIEKVFEAYVLKITAAFLSFLYFVSGKGVIARIAITPYIYSSFQ